MPEYDNNMTGVLFRNTKRVEGSKQPEYNGKIEVEGKEYSLSAWIKEGATCGKFFSIAVSEKWEPKTEAVGAAVGSEDIPF